MICKLDSEEREAKLDEVDVLETVTGAPSDKKAAKEEEIKIKEEEEQLQIQPPLKQQVENLLFSN